jgi:hypothetical protein
MIFEGISGLLIRYYYYFWTKFQNLGAEDIRIFAGH